MTEITCGHCGSGQVVPEAEVRDYDSSSYRPLAVLVPRAESEETSSLGLPGAQPTATGSIRARVCGSCGTVELFSPEAAELWAAFSGDR